MTQSLTATRTRDGQLVTTMTLPTATATAIREAIAARDAGMAQAEEADHSGWDRSLIDTAIDHLAATSTPFSANDLRELLPDDVRPALIGARFSAASTSGRIRFNGFVRSTKKNTHGKPIARWIGVAQP